MRARCENARSWAINVEGGKVNAMAANATWKK